MRVTIQQIAEKTGVSRGTVDRALNKRGRIDPEVEARIEKVAEELGYVRRARKKTEGARRIKIGVVTQLAGTDFMEEVNRGIRTVQAELKESGVDVLVEERSSVEEDAQLEAIDALLAKDIRALALMPVESEKVRAKLNELTQEKGMPVVTFNSDIVGTGRSCFVGMDNLQSGRAAAGLLGMLTRGAGRILIITGYFGSSVNNLRVEGFVEELRQSWPGLEVAGVQCSFNDPAEVQRIIETTMKSISGISGIFVVSGGQEGVKKAFSALNLEERPYVVIYDRTPGNERLLTDGAADFLIDQNGFEQGYRPPRVLAGLLEGAGAVPQERFYTDIDIRTRYNL